MELNLQNQILNQFTLQQTWTPSFVINHDGLELDLSSCCGPAAVRPSNVPDQPNSRKLPKRSVYRFPKRFETMASWEDLRSELSKCLPGATFSQSRGNIKNLSFTKFVLDCSCSRVVVPKHQDFEEDNYKQMGTKLETVKRTKTGSLSSLDKMESKTNQALLKQKSTPNKPKQPPSRRTSSQRSLTKDDACPAKIAIILWSDNFFYLDARTTSLEHSGHIRDETPKQLGIEDIDDDNQSLIQKLTTSGFRPAQISKLLNILDDDSSSEYSSKTIHNLLQQHDAFLDQDINHHMSSAEKAIHYLER